MKISSGRLYHLILLLVLLFQSISVQAQSNSDRSASSNEANSQQQSALDYSDPPYWTHWNPSMQALADDGELLWIGGVGYVIRWEKNTKQYQRIQIPDSRPTVAIHAAAVDTSGNRWFGSDDGLYRLDTDNRWARFTTENSGLYNNYVNSIVAGAEDILWISHGSSISRRNSDGSWRWYPNNTVAVMLDYIDILQTRSMSSLWTIAGDEVWIGTAVYDGSQWLDRAPVGVEYGVGNTVSDADGNVWGLCSSVCDVAMWNGSGWTEYSGLFDDHMVMIRLSSAPGSDVWADGLSYGPYGNPSRFLFNVTGDRALANVNGDYTVTLLPHADGIWAVGTGWLYPIDGVDFYFPDVPQYSLSTDILVDKDNLLWLHSFKPATWNLGTFQVVNDNGTAILEDDGWQSSWDFSIQAAEVDGLELAPNGDLWIGGYSHSRFPPNSSSIYRRHQGQWIDYTKAVESSNIRVTDIYVQNEHHIWFAYKESTIFSPLPIRGVLLLDDRGTPTNLADDIWTDYPVSKDGTGGSIVIDAQGRTWFGNSMGLFRYDGSQWQSLSQCAIGDLAATADGIVYAASRCNSAPSTILAVATDDSTLQFTIEELVESRFATLRTANRNHIWTVAPDGAIWYAQGTEVYRRDVQGLQSYPTPTGEEGINAIEIDSNNHVWVIYQSSLWRMSAKPDFLLNPTFWLVAPGYTYSRSIRVGSIEGYRQIVGLEVAGLSEDFEVTFEPESVDAGSSVALTITVAPSTTLGVYSATLIGTSDGITHTSAITLSVVSQIFDIYLPLVIR